MEALTSSKCADNWQALQVDGNIRSGEGRAMQLFYPKLKKLRTRRRLRLSLSYVRCPTYRVNTLITAPKVAKMGLLEVASKRFNVRAVDRKNSRRYRNTTRRINATVRRQVLHAHERAPLMLLTFAEPLAFARVRYECKQAGRLWAY